MTRQRRLCIDLRRDTSCGVGRSAYCTAKALELVCPAHGVSLVALLSPKTLHLREEFRDATPVLVDAPYFTNEDLFELPTIVQAHADGFWSNQFYLSPFFSVPVVTMIHDLWPVQYPEWLPNHEEVATRHGPDVTRCAEKLVRHFESTFLPRIGVQVSRAYARISRLADRFMMAMMVMAADRAQVVATCSHYSMQQISSFMPEFSHKIIVVSPYPSLTGPCVIDQREAPRDDVVLLNVAKFDPRKNHEFLINALGRLLSKWRGTQRIQVHFVGEIGYRTFGKRLVERARDVVRSPHKFVFHDMLPDKFLAALYRSSHLLLMPSLDEGFGLPLLEAMSVALPALVANRGALPEVGGRFVQYSDLDSTDRFASEMQLVLETYESAARRALEGQEEMRRRYCLERTCREVGAILDRVFLN